MPLCATCANVDVVNLLHICLLICRDKQTAVSEGEPYDTRLKNYEGSEVKHHGDIFDVEKSSKDCDLCGVIFQAFKRTNVQDVEVARGLQIMFRASCGKIDVCYNTDAKEGLIKLCALNVYMDELDVEELFQDYGIKEENSPPLLKLMEKDPASQKSLGIASRWLMNCLENHSSCMPPLELRKPPRRLIHVGNETQNPFLVETSPELQNVEWLSLSYCWGVHVQPSMELTNDKMTKWKKGIPLTDFDDTIKDAISVTRALGISYMWVDALCIVQDGKEFSQESSKMNEVYGGSTVTLVVASSKSVKDGFLKKRELTYIPVAYSVDIAKGRRAGIFLSPEWDNSKHEYNGPWSERGWTMQEGLLPNRLLHYTGSQIIWKCCEEQRFERGITERVEDRVSEILTYSDPHEIAFGSEFLWTLPEFMKFKQFQSYLPTNLDFPLMSQSHTFRLWYDLLEDYTKRKFKKMSDRLIAISGLARIYGDMIRNPTYVAGLWKEDLIRGLLWHIKGTMLISKRSTDGDSTCKKNFPSWSWVSVDAEVVVGNDLKTADFCFGVLPEIENVHINLVDPGDPFGAIERDSVPSVTLSGPLKRLPRLYNKEWASAEASMSRLERHISEIVEKESQDSVAEKYSSPPKGHFSVLKMFKDIGSLYLLVLEATGKNSNGINVYHRIGILHLRYISPSHKASPELIALLKRMETGIEARLGLREKPRKARRFFNAVFLEVDREDWRKETVMIV